MTNQTATTYCPLSAQGLYAGYDRREVLRNVSFELHPGEFVGIIGPNGCGKSTLIKALSGIIRPAKGQVMVQNEPLDQLSVREVAKRMAVVPQYEQVAFGFSCWDVVLMGRAAYTGMMGHVSAKDKQAAQEAMERMGVWEFRDRPVQQLSGGECQRVSLARAMAQQCNLLLLDEPTSHLDISNQIGLLSEIQSLRNENGHTVVAVLHEINMAAEFCDRILVMHKGGIVADGTPAEVINPHMLKRVFTLDALVRVNPVTGRPHILPRSLPVVDAAGDGARVHMVIGGGSSTPWMAALVSAGYAVTAGVVNLLDSDEQGAHEMGVELVVEAPFTPISEESIQQLREVVGACRAVVVGPAWIGHGNLANLHVVMEALQRGASVILAGTDLEGRDFTDGEASRIWAELISMGAQVVGSPDQAVAILQERIIS